MCCFLIFWIKKQKQRLTSFYTFMTVYHVKTLPFQKKVCLRQPCERLVFRLKGWTVLYDVGLEETLPSQGCCINEARHQKI